jgi:hypothetical protein
LIRICLRLCEESVREVTGDAPRLPSGALHDAAEMVAAHAGSDDVCLFHRRALALQGRRHARDHLEKAIGAFLVLVDKTVASVARN